MPASGTAIVPIANARQTSRTYAADVASSASPSTPDRNGRSTRSSTGPRTPAAARSVAADRPPCAATRRGPAATTRVVHTARLALSRSDTSRSTAIRSVWPGSRRGSP